MKISNILILFFSGICVLFELYFWVISFVWFFLQVILISLGVTLIIKIFPAYKSLSFKTLFISASRYILLVFGVSLTFFLTIIVYYNIVPAKLSQITLSQSGQTVVFLQMSHIASPEFYDIQKKTIDTLSASGYIFLIEWVWTGTKKSEDTLAQMFGFKFTPTLYSRISDTIGFAPQDNSYLFSGVPTEQRASVDISLDDIVRLASWSILTPQASVVDIEKELENITTLSEHDKLFLHCISRAFFQWALLQSDTLEKDMFWDSALFDVILHTRNQKIIDYIEKHPKQKIAVVYGALHFSWVYDALHTKNPLWKIDSYPSFSVYGESPFSSQ